MLLNKRKADRRRFAFLFYNISKSENFEFSAGLTGYKNFAIII